MLVEHREVAFGDAIKYHLLNEAGCGKQSFDGGRAIDELREYRFALISTAVIG